MRKIGRGAGETCHDAGNMPAAKGETVPSSKLPFFYDMKIDENMLKE